MTVPIISVQGVKKSYGATQAVRNVSFDVGKGTMLSILGANGAGKSTMIGMLCTLIPADDGGISICGYQMGKDDYRIREKIGIVFQESLLDGRLTVEENLLLRACFYYGSRKEAKRHVRQAAEETKIEGLLPRIYGTLSGGEKRRTDLARAFLHTPEVLFLDEPTTGLDPKVRYDIWKVLKGLKKKGTTIVYSTHYMEEAEHSDHLLFMKKGRIVASGSPEQLTRRYGKNLMEIECKNRLFVKRKLCQSGFMASERQGRLLLPIESSKDVIQILQIGSDYVTSFEMRKATMDDVFMEVLGEGNNDSDFGKA